MDSKELKRIEEKLPRGGKWELSRLLQVDPSKITKAFSGLVKDEVFMERLLEEARKLLKSNVPAKS